MSDTRIKEVIATFPATFGLRSFSGLAFRISETSSFFSGEQLFLYTEVQQSGGWVSFAKGTERELRRQLVDAPKHYSWRDLQFTIDPNVKPGGAA